MVTLAFFSLVAEQFLSQDSVLEGYCLATTELLTTHKIRLMNFIVLLSIKLPLLLGSLYLCSKWRNLFQGSLNNYE